MFYNYYLIFFIKLRKRDCSDKPVLILVILGGLTGLGGTIFLSHPDRVTLQIDLIPIKIFGLSYILFSMRRFFKRSYAISVLVTIAFILFSAGFYMAVKGFRMPGLDHIPSILVLVVMGLLLIKSNLYNKVAKAFIIAAGTYTVALFFRYLDLIVYRSFPLGTHFLWHIFASCVVFVLLYSAAMNGSVKHHEYPATDKG